MGHKLLGLISALLIAAGAANAEQSPGFYDEWARRGQVVTNSGLADSAEVDTLVIADLSGQETANVLADSTAEEHAVGAEYWTLSLRVRNPLGRCDSLWVHFYAESGSGPMTNPDGSSTIVAADSTNDRYGVWGIHRFATQDTTAAWRSYPLKLTRGRGTIYVMGRFLHSPSRWQLELWKGSDR